MSNNIPSLYWCSSQTLDWTKKKSWEKLRIQLDFQNQSTGHQTIQSSIKQKMTFSEEHSWFETNSKTAILYRTFKMIFIKHPIDGDKSYKTKQINSFNFFFSSKKRNKHSVAKLTINNSKTPTMLKCLKTNVAKTEQDALTTTGGSYCLIVCGSHKNACSGRVFLSHRLRKIICFMGKQHRETERYSLEGRRSQRALFAHNCCDALVRELGVSTGPPGRLWGWRPKKTENPRGPKKT